MTFSGAKNFRFALFCCVCLISLFSVQETCAQADVATVINQIQNSPTLFYSPEASAYFTNRPASSSDIQSGTISGTVDKDAAFRTFRDILKLSDMGAAAKSAIPVLIDKYPKGVHVRVIQNAHYAGEGTFDDWVNTYVMSEKNNFMVTSPFLDYNSMTKCEQYIDATYQTDILYKKIAPKKGIIDANVNITIILTFNIAACALSAITGFDIGPTQDQWRQWWMVNQSAYANQSLSSRQSSTSINNSSKGITEFIKGGKYRVMLTTGDDLTGTIESIADTSIILETESGKPYLIRAGLIASFETLSVPTEKTAPAGNEISAPPKDSTVLAYDQLKQYQKQKLRLELRIKSGTVFKGMLSSIDDEMVRIDVDGAVIPISRDVIEKILTLPAAAQQQDALPKKSVVSGPYDTIFVSNENSDDWGKPLPDSIFTGVITAESNDSLTFRTITSEIRHFQRSAIEKILRHTTSSFDEPIKRYAKQLKCPSDMILIDMPPGKAGRPYFKVCVDKYEFPNREGIAPQTNVSFAQAQSLCAKTGKRLCTADEWQWTCGGLDNFIYPYGWNFEKERCNTESRPEASGSRIKCVSKLGVYDMVGNVFEWVTNTDGRPTLMGGPYSKCQTLSPGTGGDAKPTVGFRCCLSN